MANSIFSINATGEKSDERRGRKSEEKENVFCNVDFLWIHDDEVEDEKTVFGDKRRWKSQDFITVYLLNIYINYTSKIYISLSVSTLGECGT